MRHFSLATPAHLLSSLFPPLIPPIIKEASSQEEFPVVVHFAPWVPCHVCHHTSAKVVAIARMCRRALLCSRIAKALMLIESLAHKWRRGAWRVCSLHHAHPLPPPPIFSEQLKHCLKGTDSTQGQSLFNKPVTDALKVKDGQLTAFGSESAVS